MIKNELKVLLCSPFGGTIGGISRWTKNILSYYKEIDNKDFVLDVFSISRSKEIFPGDSLLYRIVEGLKDYITILSGFSKKLKSDRFDLVHITTSASISLIKDILMLTIARRHGIKTIIHFHFGRIPDLYVKKNWEQKLLNIVIKLSNKAIVIDMKSYNTLINEKYRNIEFLPNPLTPYVLEKVQRFSYIKKENRKIVFVGHIIPTKGVFELVEACKYIDNIKLKLIGFSNDLIKQDLLLLSERNELNQWLDICGELKQEAVIKEMLSADVFVLPSYTEGFPNVILESMACGCPIVATEVGAIPEMLDIYGTNPVGLCVEPKNVEYLRDSIMKMLKDQDFALQCGRNAQIRVNEIYSMPNVWNKMVFIWKNLLN